ncbi:hypothetical protein BBJ28_00013588 [Nothophytophthora sp. Chile5]|nr:hypothetical protein BBJ28_00013588 [Nothophytophthora sp. Chile5]
MAFTAFPSWDAFFSYFTEYQSQTFQMYASKSSTSVATRNQRIRESAATSSGSASASMATGEAASAADEAPTSASSRLAGASGRALQFVPPELGVYAKTLICTHGGKPRSRSQGIRPRQRFRPMQCPAKLGHDSAQVSGWQVVVTHHVVTHNHPLDAETYMAYPQNRRVQDPQVLETVNALRKAGVKQRQIRAYLAEKAPNKRVTKSDVHNLLTKMKDDASYTATLRAASQAATPTATSTHGDHSTGVFTAVPVPQQPLNWTQAGNTVGNPGPLPSQAQAQLTAVATRSRELQAEQARLLQQGGSLTFPVSLGPSPSGNSGDNGGGGGGLSSLIVQNSTSSGGNTANPLRDLSASGEISSGSFKLRVSRLEEQNLSLYAQNTTLREQNQQHATDLYEAQGKIREADGRLVALQKSESTLTEAVSALSHEVASLKAENARWKQQVEHLMGQIPAPNSGIVGMQPMEMRPNNVEQRPTWLAASQGLPLVGAGRMDMLGGSADGQETMSHLAKRPLGGGVSELAPPPKRPTTFQTAEENGGNGGDGGQRFSGGYVFSS